MIKLTVLSENSAGSGFLAEHGLSYLVQDGQTSVLFDTGASDVFLQNAKRLGLNVDELVTTIVLSHGHWDHGNGLMYLKGKQLITHPSAFIKRYRRADRTSVGLGFGFEKAKQHFDIKMSVEPLQVSANIWFLGEIPRKNDFESKSTSFIDASDIDDFVPDDSALAIRLGDELIVVTGCSHAGICNIVEYASALTGLNKVKAVIGGFHLKKNNAVTRSTLNYFKAREVKAIYPSHCTALDAKCALFTDYPVVEVMTGRTYIFEIAPASQSQIL